MADNSPSTSTNTQKGFSGAEYNYVAMNARLRLISLVSSSFKVNASCVAERKKWKLSYDWDATACQFSREEKNVTAIFQYVVVAKLGRQVAMKCVAEYVVYYEIPEDSSDEAAVGFCNNVGAFAAYPYFRGLVAQLASSANLIIPPLPNIASTAHIPKKQEAGGRSNGTD